MKFIVLGILSFSWATTLTFTYVAISAMIIGNGLILLDFNRYHEGWLEVGLLAMLSITTPWVIWKLLKIII